MPTAKDILAAIAEHLGLSADDLDRQASIRDELSLGPIELNDLLLFLSQKYEVHFNKEDVEDIKTVDDLIVLVEDNLLE